MNRREFVKLGGGLGLTLLFPAAAWAAHGRLRVINNTQHHLTIHGRHESYGPDQWIEAGHLRAHYQETWSHLEHGRWRIRARNAEGREWGPYEVFVHENYTAQVVFG